MAPVPKQKRQRQRHFLREWREYLNLNQEAAADRIGVTQSKLSRIETYKSPYDQDFLEEAAIAYGVSPASLIMRDPNDQDSVWALEEHLKNATPEKREQFKTVLEFVFKTGTRG
ncbi:helix-turn-helix domain-containing protein [Phyllobacterium sp. 22229]|uniref:helix-turn-helix domain-containing protein n=1 Tax=Phyllobacterium sp. 22229 TaxID=3453895 RepID=UPI003F82A678